MIKLTEDLEDPSEVFADRKFYAEAKRVIERTVAEGQTAHATKWLRTLQLGLARHAGEQEDEAALRKELGRKMSPQALRKLGLGFADFKD